MNSLYIKSGMNNQKAAFLKRAIKSTIKQLPHHPERPDIKLKYINGFTGYIEFQSNLNESKDINIIDSRSFGKAHELMNMCAKKEIFKTNRPVGRPLKYRTKNKTTETDIQDFKNGMIKELCHNMNIKEKDLDMFFKKNEDIFKEYITALICFSQS